MSDLIERHQKVVVQLLDCAARIKELEAAAQDNAEHVGDLVEQLRRLGYEDIRRRAELEAYKAAAKALRDIEERPFGWEARQIARDALAALRAAGIMEEKT